jgi:hypothetical protein
VVSRGDNRWLSGRHPEHNFLIELLDALEEGYRNAFDHSALKRLDLFVNYNGKLMQWYQNPS